MVPPVPKTTTREGDAAACKFMFKVLLSAKPKKTVVVLAFSARGHWDLPQAEAIPPQPRAMHHPLHSRCAMCVKPVVCLGQDFLCIKHASSALFESVNSYEI
jgi:hypothetical protein